MPHHLLIMAPCQLKINKLRHVTTKNTLTHLELFSPSLSLSFVTNHQQPNTSPSLLPHPQDLKRLSVLGSQYNRLMGPIPSSLGNLKMLRGLDLSFNGFSGGIPAGLTDIPQLDFLEVQNNFLFGFVPSGIPISYILDYSKTILFLTVSFLLLWLCIDLY